MAIKHVIENGEPFSLLADGTKFFLNNNQYILPFSNVLLVKQQFRYSVKGTKIWSSFTYNFMLLSNVKTKEERPNFCGIFRISEL